MFTHRSPRLRFIDTPAEPLETPTPPAGDVPPAAAPVVPKPSEIPAATPPVDADDDDTDLTDIDLSTLTDDAIKDWPKEARATVKKANRAAQNYRNQKIAAVTERDNAMAEAYRKIGIDLGVVKADESLTPAELAARLTDENGTLNAGIAERDQKLAGYRRRDAINAASALEGGDTPLLTAVLNANDEFTTLDLNADDYDARVAAIVRAEVAKNPKLKATPVVPQSTGGSPPSGDPTPVDETSSVEAAREARRKRRER